MPTKNFLSFGEQVLLDRPIRMDIVYSRDDFFVLNKPNGVHLDKSADPNGKNIIAALGEKNPEAFYKPVYPLEYNISGCSIIATHRESSGLLRNAYGSEALLFKFTVLCRDTEHLDSEIVCNLPLAKHFSKPMAVISRSTGKKSQTKFSLIERIGNFSIYEASCNYLRYHQVRLHGANCGLKILGEDTYDYVPVPSIEDFKKVYPMKRTASPLFTSQCIHLGSIVLNSSILGEEVTLVARPPKNFETLLKIIRRFS
ncbi:MAG: hypothetical protein LBB20_01505 [Puniceicoccales bacterium]|nr:hypothetical protein [Puniceicoccales bacterium]